MTTLRPSLLAAAIGMMAAAQSVSSPLYQTVPETPGAWIPTAAASLQVPDADTAQWSYSGVKSGTVLDMALAEPVALPRGTQHIAFWLKGADVAVNPVVVDSSGERFVYRTRSTGKGWRYVSTLLVDPYNGGRLAYRDMATFSGGNGNRIPDWPLKLVGLEVTTGGIPSDTIAIRDIAFDLSKQSDDFAQWSIGDTVVKSLVPKAEQPYLLVSDICKDNGHYQVLWRVYDLSETRLLWQGEAKVDYDSDHPTPFPADRVRIPVLTPGNYSLKVAVIDRDADPGDISARRDSAYRLRVLRGQTIAPPLAADVKPLGTCVAVDPDKHSVVYTAAEPKIVTVRVWKPDQDGPYALTCYYRHGADTTNVPTVPVVFSGKTHVDVPVSLTAWDSQASPTATFGVQLAAGGTSVERREVLLGAETPTPAPVANGPTHEAVVKKYGNLVTGGNFDRDIFDCTQQQFEANVAALQAAGYNCYIFRLTWKPLNPLPGVFDYSVLDQRIAYLRKKQMAYILQLNWSFKDQPDWLDYDLMEDQSGDTAIWSAESPLPTAADRKLRAGIASLIKATASRYASDPLLVGYEFLGVGCDWLQPDAPYLGVTVDYSPASRAAFQNYLRTVKGYDIAAVNARYHSHYASLADVPMPSPNFTGAPDLSPQWRDWMQYKLWFPTDYIDFLARTVRSVDPTRTISLYAMGGVWMPLAKLKSLGIVLANGGAENEHQPLPRYSHEMLYGLPDRSESVSCEFGSEIRLDSCAFNMLSIGGLGTSINNFWRAEQVPYSGPDGERQKTYYAKWLRILDELKTSKPKIDDIAILCSHDSLFYDTRTIFGDVAWFPDWDEGRMLYNEENLRPQWVYEDDISLGLPGKKMAVFLTANSRIVEPGTIPKLVDYVKKGGTLVIDLLSGDQVAEPAGSHYALWHALGLPNPIDNAALFDTKSSRYRTNVTEGGGFWPANGPIVFDEPLYFADGLPGGKPLLRDAAGRILCWEFHVGNGAVIAFPGKLDYGAGAPFLGALYAKLGGKVPVTNPTPEIRTWWLVTDTAKYLVVHRYLHQGLMGDASSDAKIRALGSVSGAIGINALSPGTYRLDCLTSPGLPSITKTRDELQTSGVDYKLCQGETTVWRISPAK